MSDLGDTISAAVDKAEKAVTAGNTPAAADPSSAGSPTPAPAPASPPVAPAAASGSEAAPPAAGSTVPPTTPAPAASDSRGVAGSPTQDPPKERWSSILETAREKSRRSTLETLGIRADQDTAALRPHIELLLRDEVLYAQALVESLKQRKLWPDAAAAPPQPGAQPPAAASLPKPMLVSVDGVPGYSADQVLEVVQYELGKFREELNGNLKPLQTAHERRELTELATKAWNDTAAEIAGARKDWFRFKELEPEIREVIRANPDADLRAAYHTVLQTKLPTLDADAEKRARERLTKDIQAAPDPNTLRPGQPAVSQAGGKRKSRDLDDRITRALDHAASLPA